MSHELLIIIINDEINEVPYRESSEIKIRSLLDLLNGNISTIQHPFVDVGGESFTYMFWAHISRFKSYAATTLSG